MTTKREREEAERKARMLALVGAGAEHYRETLATVEESPKPIEKDIPKPQEMPVRAPETGRGLDEEPMIFGPDEDDPARYLVKRRRSLRDDPAWVGTTLYLRRETHAALQEFCRQAGLDMSRVVQYCVGIQMDEKQRSPVLTQLLGE